MTDKKFKEYLKKIDKSTKEVSSSPEKAKEFLLKTGIYTKNGKLTKHYRD